MTTLYLCAEPGKEQNEIKEQLVRGGYRLALDFDPSVQGVAVCAGWEKNPEFSALVVRAVRESIDVRHVGFWLTNAPLYVKEFEEQARLPVTGSETLITDPETGGMKGQKPARFSLIPPRPLWELAEHFGKGALKYADHNWARGYAWSLNYDAALRHLMQFWAGEDIDASTGSKHVIAAAWHCLILAYRMDVHENKDDRPHHELGEQNVPPVPH